MKGMVIIMKEERKEGFKHVVLPIIIAVISAVIVYNFLNLIKWNRGYLEDIHERTQIVDSLDATSAALAFAIEAIPGDAGTSLANELMRAARTLFIVRSALTIEEYILKISAAVVFIGLVPVSCIAYSAGYNFKKDGLKIISMKILAFALAFLLLVPFSLTLSGAIEKSYQDTLNETIEEAEAEADNNSASADKDEDSNVLDTVIGGVKNLFGKVANKVTKTAEDFENLVSNMIQSIITMLITNCGIPILVMIIFYIIIKNLFNLNLDSKRYADSVGGFVKNGTKKAEK